MEGVTIVEHPLVQHKLTLLRDKTRSTKVFRELFNEIGALLCYEATRDLPLETIEVETPLAPMRSPVLAGKEAGAGAGRPRRHGLSRRHAQAGADPRASPMSGFIAIRARWSRSNISSRRRTKWPSG